MAAMAYYRANKKESSAPIGYSRGSVFDVSYSQGAKGLKYSLTQCIYEALQEEFEKSFSGNLKNTIKIEESSSVLGVFGDGADEALLYGESDYKIIIEAQRYDIQIFKETGQIVHTNYKRAGGSERKNREIIRKLKVGKTIDEITREDILRDLKKKKQSMVVKRGYYDDILAGSYAEEVDITGGFSKSHQNYVERCIKKGIERWKSQYPDLDISSNL